MDLNPVFTSATSFRPSGSVGNGGELKLFEYAGILLVHGWVVDPSSPEAEVFKRVNDYDAAVALIAEVDHLTNGQFVVNEDEFAPIHGVSTNGNVPSMNYTPEELTKIQDGILHPLWFEIDANWSLSYFYTSIFGHNPIAADLPWPLPSRHQPPREYFGCFIPEFTPFCTVQVCTTIHFCRLCRLS